LIPGSGVAAAYASSANPSQEADAIAIYLTAWMIITFLFLSVYCSFFYFTLRSDSLSRVLVIHSIAALRKSVGLTALFFLLTTTFMLLAVGEYRLFVRNRRR